MTVFLMGRELPVQLLPVCAAAPALEGLTNQVYERTKVIKEIKHVKLLDFDLDSYGVKVLIKEQFMVSRGGFLLRRTT